MKYTEARPILDKYRDILVGKGLVNAHGVPIPGQTITYLFIAPINTENELFSQWYSSGDTNENILKSNGLINNSDLEIYIWSLGNNQYSSELQAYLKIINES